MMQGLSLLLVFLLASPCAGFLSPGAPPAASRRRRPLAAADEGKEDEPPEMPKKPSLPVEELLYVLGCNVAEQSSDMKRLFTEEERKVIIEGMTDVLMEKEPLKHEPLDTLKNYKAEVRPSCIWQICTVCN